MLFLCSSCMKQIQPFFELKRNPQIFSSVQDDDEADRRSSVSNVSNEEEDDDRRSSVSNEVDRNELPDVAYQGSQPEGGDADGDNLDRDADTFVTPRDDATEDGSLELYRDDATEDGILECTNTTIV
jgi:hypothetical protein